MQPLLDGGWWLPRTRRGGRGHRRWSADSPGRCACPLRCSPLLQFGALLVTPGAAVRPRRGALGVPPGTRGHRPPAGPRRPGPRLRRWRRGRRPGPNPGLLLLIVAGIGLAALVVDTLAAGLDLPGMTLIPLGALFVVPWAGQPGLGARGGPSSLVAAGLAGGPVGPPARPRLALEPGRAGRAPPGRAWPIAGGDDGAGPARRWARRPCAGPAEPVDIGTGSGWRDRGGRRAGLPAPIAGRATTPGR